MEGYKCVITLYMLKHKGVIDVQKILNFIFQVANSYDVTYDEFGFSYVSEKKEITKTLKYTQKNIEKLNLIEAQDITALSFDQYKEQKHFADPRFRLDFFLPKNDDYPNRFSVIIDSHQMKKSLTSELIKELIYHICSLGFHIEFGAAFLIETKKAPHYFIMGTVSKHLSTEEKDMASALALNIRQYESKIWDIFWFNIIKKTLIPEEVLNDIMKILPSEYILNAGDKYIISLPLTSEEYVSDKVKLDFYREELRLIFRENDLVMYTGQQFPHYV